MSQVVKNTKGVKSAFETAESNLLLTNAIENLTGGTINIGSVNSTNTLNLGCGTGVQVVNIGTGTGVSTINIGASGDTVAISGTLITVNTSNLQVDDKAIVLNKNGLALSAPNSGILFEEAGMNTGHILVDATRAGFILQPPSFYDVTPDLYNIYLGEDGLKIKNKNNMGIETYFSSDATKRVRLSVSSAGTDAGATLLTNKDYCDLKLWAYNNGTTPKEMMLRNEARTANLYTSSNDTGELQITDNAGTKLAYIGKNTTRLASPNVQIAGAATLSSTLNVTGAATLSSTLGVTGATTLGALSASSLNLSGTDLVFTSSTKSGSWTGPATSSGSVTVKRIGNVVFLTATAVPIVTASTTTLYWIFSQTIDASYRPAATISGTCVINHNSDTVPAGVGFVTNSGQVLIYDSNPGGWTAGNGIGFNNGFSIFWFV